MPSDRHGEILVTNTSQLLRYIPEHKSKSFSPKYLPPANQQLFLLLTSDLVCTASLSPQSREHRPPQGPWVAQVTVSPHADGVFWKPGQGCCGEKAFSQRFFVVWWEERHIAPSAWGRGPPPLCL